MLCATNRLFRSIAPVLVGVTILTAGCTESQDDATKPTTVNQKDSTEETAAERCRKKLSAAIRRLDPQTVASQDDPERSINGLNAWISSCAADQVGTLALNDSALSMIGNSPRATASRYTANDGAYIRDCLLLRKLTDAISARSAEKSGSTGADFTQVEAIFDWVVRNVSLIPATEERVPLGLFDVVLTGRGTVEDRAWVLAEALRQQQIDAVIVRSDQEQAAEGTRLQTASWLVAVLLDRKSLLLDVEAGFPLPGNTKTEEVVDTADVLSVAELGEHDRWKNSSVQIVAQISAFAPRMLVLQEQLAAEDSAILFEELTGGVSEIVPLIERVTKAGDGLWDVSDISLWPHPEAQVVASNALNETQKQAYAQLKRPFQAPFTRKDFAPESTEEMTTVPEELKPEERKLLVEQRLMDSFEKMLQSSEDMFGTPSNALLKARIEQIQGSIETGVIQQLQQIRIASMQESLRIRVPEAVQKETGYPPIMVIPFPDLIREVNLGSTGDSLYWTALCQIEREEVGAAITTLVNYRRQYPEGKWKYATLINQAIALLEQKRTEDATAILKEADVEANPEQSRVQQLLRSIAQ